MQEVQNGRRESRRQRLEAEEDQLKADQILEWRKFVRLAAGEYPIRNFFVSLLWILPPARANLLVTNLRVILYGIGGTGIFGRHRVVQEVHLDKIVGLACYLAWGLNLLMLGLGIAMLIGGILPFLHLSPALLFLDNPRFAPLWYALIIMGILLMALCFRQMFYVTVNAFGGLAQEITLKAKRGFGWSAGPDLQLGMKPGPDALSLVRELGAVILDAQNGAGTPDPSFSFPVEVEPESPPPRRAARKPDARKFSLRAAMESEGRSTGSEGR